MLQKSKPYELLHPAHVRHIFPLKFVLHPLPANAQSSNSMAQRAR
jgi:hypothetical protein